MNWTEIYVNVVTIVLPALGVAGLGFLVGLDVRDYRQARRRRADEARLLYPKKTSASA